jgi:hypothetical protein
LQATTALLDHTLDPASALGAVGELLVPAHAAACIFLVLRPDGSFERAALCGANESWTRRLDELPLGEVLEDTLRSQPIPWALTEGGWLLPLPLRARGRDLGALLVALGEPPTREIVGLLGEIARRAALSVEAAQRYLAAQRAAAGLASPVSLASVASFANPASLDGGQAPPSAPPVSSLEAIDDGWLLEPLGGHQG